jgi:hypothetical protein
MTVAMLLENTLAAAKRQLGLCVQQSDNTVFEQ